MELVALRDKFANRLSHQVNAMVVRFCSQLMRIAPSGNSSSISGAGVSGSLVDLSRHHHRLHGTGSGSVLSLSGSRSNLSTAGGGVDSGASLNHCYELLKVQRSEMLKLSPLVGGWLQKNRSEVFRTLKKVGLSWFIHTVRRQILRITKSNKSKVNTDIFNMRQFGNFHS